MGIELTRFQEEAVKNRGGGLLVSAAAGSGKTRVLVERLLDRILREGHDIDRFLIITFTRAAAEELRGRIAQELSKKLLAEPENRHLRRQIPLLYQTQISTIHGFCTGLLRQWGHMLDIPSDFSLCEDEDASILKRQILIEVLESRYEALDPEGNFAQLLEVLSAGRDDSKLIEIVLDVYERIQSHHNPKGWAREQIELWQLQDIEDVGQTTWGDLLLHDSKKMASYWVSELSKAIAMAVEDEQLVVYEESLSISLQGLTSFVAATESGWDYAVDCADIPFPRLKAVRDCQDIARQESIKSIRERCKKAVGRLSERFSDHSSALLSDMKVLFPAMVGLFELVDDFEAAFSAEKRRRRLVDFTDLEHLSVRLLTDEDGNPTDLAEELSTQFVELMVDEYQDTNQVQNSIFSALSQKGENLFFVGDVKQSIYRFRLADPGIFLEKYHRFLPFELAEPGQERKILLSQNFRSRPEVIESVNDVFRCIMSEELGDMNYTQDEALYPGASFPDGDGFETELFVLDFTEQTKEKEQEQSKNQLEAQFVANRIAAMLQEGFPVSGENNALRPVQPDDFAILLRSPGRVRHHYIRALGTHGIPCAGSGDEDFFETVEIETILSYLQIIDNPYQDVPLISVLHSPLFGFDAEQLAKIRQAQSGDFYTALQAYTEGGDAACQGFLTDLHALRFQVGEFRSHELLWSLYQKTKALEIFSSLPNGTEREKRLLAFYELAARFESRGHKGLFRFLAHLQKIREAGTPLLIGNGEEAKGVQILSIHKSKGLEFPIVFLGGLGKSFNKTDLYKPVLFHQELGLGPNGVDVEKGIAFQTIARQAVSHKLWGELLAEEMRLLYVAMTRAKEKLIMTHTLTYGLSELKKLAEDVSMPLDPQVLKECNSIGKWVILSAMLRPEATVLYEAIGSKSLAPWNEFSSRWLIHYQSGLSEESIKISLETETSKNEGIKTALDPEEIWERLMWRYPYESLSSVPAKLTATQLIEEEQASMDDPGRKRPVARPDFAAKAFGLTPAQMGTAYHVVLQNISLDRCDRKEDIEAELARLEQEAFLSPQERGVVDAEKLYTFFQTPVGLEMRRAKELHREFPFSLLMPASQYDSSLPDSEQILLQGVIDCWFETEEGITILDFKSNRIGPGELETKAEHYRKQLDTYRYALGEMVKKPVKRCVIWFLHPNAGITYE